jgi:peptide/nickel transport system ATP-binding protein
MTGPVLQVRDLSVAYGTGPRAVHAVQDVSLDLAPGRMLGMAGESGSGKSTLALSLLRLLPSAARVSGQVLFEGEDLMSVGWGRLRAVRWSGASVVFQGAMSALNPVQTIGEQIAEPIVLHDLGTPAVARRRVGELLESVGLPAARAGAYPHELSGGQRQRVMIAMALACDPDLIIADEPNTALDVMVQAQILGLLGRIVRERGLSMLMISHDLLVLAELCDELAVMYAGRVVEHGPSRTVVTEPQHPYTRALVRAFPTLGDPASRRAPSGVPGDPATLRAGDVGCSFAPRCPLVLDRCREGVIDEVAIAADHRARCVRLAERTEASA